MGFQIEDNAIVKYIDEGETDIVIPDNINLIEERAFQGYTKIKNVTFKSGVTFISVFAFHLCDIYSVTIPYNNFTGKDKWVFLCTTKFRSITIIGQNINITLNSEKFEIDNAYPNGGAGNFFDFICFEPNVREEFFEKCEISLYKIPCALLLMFENNNKKAEAYIRENIVSVVKWVIDNGDSEILTKILSFGYVKEDNIDVLIKYVIERKKAEMQVILMNYKNNNFGFRNNFDSLIIE